MFLSISLYEPAMTGEKTIVPSSEIRRTFLELNWEILWPDLIAHTVHRLRYRYGVKREKKILQSMGRKIVSEIIDIVFVAETRKWNTSAYECIEDFLRSAIDSHINNSLNGKIHEIDDERALLNALTIPEAEFSSLNLNELKGLIMEELKLLNADDDELLVFECLFDGIYKPKEIREALGISESEFSSIWRRVGRKQDRLQIKLAQHGY